MTDTAPRREFLGGFLGFTERMRVFRTPEAVEVDATDRYEIRRRRVYFDEVLLATLHRERGGGPYPWLFLTLTLLAGLLVLPFLNEPDPRNIVLASTGALGLLTLGAFLLPAWIVTVYGKRARGKIRYRLREGKARAVYGEICRAAAEAQRALAERQAATAPEPEVPLPPALTPDPSPASGRGEQSENL